MCIRDRINPAQPLLHSIETEKDVAFYDGKSIIVIDDVANTCLLYTSDAADERSSVDLGGRRIIKKKKNKTKKKQKQNKKNKKQQNKKKKDKQDKQDVTHIYS